MIRHLCLIMTLGAATLSAWSAPSILDIKHSITDNNIVAPESFETKTRELRSKISTSKHTPNRAITLRSQPAQQKNMKSF